MFWDVNYEAEVMASANTVIQIEGKIMVMTEDNFD